MSYVDLTAENFDEVVAKNDITVMDFWAEWCGPCKSFSPIFEQVAEANPDVTFAKIDIDGQQELAQAFAVRSIPQIVVMKHDVVVYSESGTLPVSSLQDLIDQARAVDVSDIK
jgi:thioredoxin 1